MFLFTQLSAAHRALGRTADADMTNKDIEAGGKVIDHTGVAFRSTVNKQGPWKLGFVVTSGCSGFWFLEDVIGLFG